jgi:hypothetical protein
MAKSSPKAVPIYGALGPRRPEAYRLAVQGVHQPIFVLGPYDIETGGCDSVQPYSLILELLDKYSVRGHVVFEGSLISDNYGQVGAWLERQGQKSVVAFMETPLEECLRRVRTRRTGRGNDKEFNPTNTTRRYGGVQKFRSRIEADGKMRVVGLHGLPDFEAVVEEVCCET